MRFIFIDRITDIEKDKSAQGIKNLSMSEDYFEHHFPYFPIMPGVLMIEATIELARWLVLYSNDFKYYSLLESLIYYKVRNPAQPGDVLNVRVDYIEKKEMSALFMGRIFIEGEMIAEGKFENRFIELIDSESKDTFKKQYQFITMRFREMKQKRV